MNVRYKNLATETLYKERYHEYLERRNRRMQQMGRFLTKRERGRLWEDMQSVSDFAGLDADPTPSGDSHFKDMSDHEQDNLVANVSAMFRGDGMIAKDEMETEEQMQSRGRRQGSNERSYKPFGS